MQEQVRICGNFSRLTPSFPLRSLLHFSDHAFSLLLQKNAGEFPIVYVARIGKTHRGEIRKPSLMNILNPLLILTSPFLIRLLGSDIAILLCGALSRYVNQLDEADFEKKATLVILRQLRTNLKLAIDHALEPSGDTSLLSSYFQVLIMSEGDVWLKKAIHEVSLVMKRWNVPTLPPMVETNPSSRPETGARRPSTHGRRSESSDGPVGVANKMVRDFCTKELKTLEGGGHRHAGDVGVEEYIANATMDLVILAGWSLIVERTPVEMLPVSLPTCFALDVSDVSPLLMIIDLPSRLRRHIHLLEINEPSIYLRKHTRPTNR